jgi:RNA polymerase sigma-70 factor (ECF subfamily)
MVSAHPARGLTEDMSAREADAAYEALVRSHRAAFQRLAYRLARNPEDAQDLLQETLLDAYRSFHHFRAGSQFYNWIARIMTNNHLDRIRRKQWATTSLDQAAPDSEPLELADESTDPARLVIERRLDHSLQSALNALHPAQRETVLLCDLEGATYEEAARAEDCPIGTIRSRLHRAHKAIQGFLANLEPPRPPLPTSDTPSKVHSRRAILSYGAAAALGGLAAEADAAAPTPVRALVWTPTNSSPAADRLARELEQQPGLSIRRASGNLRRAEPTAEELSGVDVVVWWGGDPMVGDTPDQASPLASRVRHDGLGLVVVGASDSCPALERLGSGAAGEARSPAGTPGELWVEVTAPRHPVAAELAAFAWADARCFGAPTPLPRPSVVVLSAAAPSAEERIPIGVAWRSGQGRIFHLAAAPANDTVGHPELPQLLRRAVGWCADAPVS